MASDDEEKSEGTGEGSDEEDSEESPRRRPKPVKIKIEPTFTSRNLNRMREAEKGPQHPPYRMAYVFGGFGVFFLTVLVIGLIIWGIASKKSQGTSGSPTSPTPPSKFTTRRTS